MFLGAEDTAPDYNNQVYESINRFRFTELVTDTYPFGGGAISTSVIINIMYIGCSTYHVIGIGFKRLGYIALFDGVRR